MHHMVQSFSQLRDEARDQAGGKGATLARLYQSGYPVPPGLVILPQAFDGDELLPQAWSQVLEMIKPIRNGDSQASFAVRSSALSEDSALASFAGEFETVLDVHSDEMIRQAIHTVRRSRHSLRVQAYSEAKGLDFDHQVAVVVQKLVRADISGILFTADPVSGSRKQMTGNFIYGLGDELVSGEVEPYTFTFERPKGGYHGPPELRRFARRLYKLAERLEIDLKNPQDIEWAVIDGKVYILQSRPITTLQEFDPITQTWNSSYTGDYLWGDSGGIFPEVLTPSAWSVWQIIFEQSKMDVRLMGNIGGRLYLNASVLYSIYRKLGRSHDVTVNMLSLMIGKIPPGMEIPEVPISLRELLKNFSLSLLLRQNRIRKQGQGFLDGVATQCKQFNRRIRQANDRELVALWEDEIHPFFMDIYLFQDAANEGYWPAYLKLRKALEKVLSETEVNALLASIGEGKEQSAGIGISLGLEKVARGEMTREQYLALYGHRHANENELAVPRIGEDPAWIDEQLALYQRDSTDITARIVQRKTDFAQIWSDFERRFPKNSKGIRAKIDHWLAAIHMREAIRTELTRYIGVTRQWYLRAAELCGLGQDVFMFTWQEILDILKGDRSVLQHLDARREAYEKYRALPQYPAWIRGRFDPIRWAADPQRRHDAYDAHAPLPSLVHSDTLEGFPGSAGRVEGTVRRIDCLEEGNQLQPGEILVAVTTNVGWTPLFPRAAAVITDIGAPLAHAAIVARELGIPAVVGCGNATVRLHTGDRVFVDGSQGVVKILETI